MRARRHQTPEIVLCRKMSVSRIAFAAVIVSCFSCSLTAPPTRQKNELNTSDLVTSILHVNEGRNKGYPSLSDDEIQNFIKFLKQLGWFESIGQYSNIGISVNRKRNTPVTRSEMKEDVTKGFSRENNARNKVANRMPWNRSAVFSSILKRFGGFDSRNHYSEFETFQKRNTSLVSHEMKEDASKYRGMEYSPRDRIVKRNTWYRLMEMSNMLNLFGGFHLVNHYSKFGKFQKRNSPEPSDEMEKGVIKDERIPIKDLGIESNARDKVVSRMPWFRSDKLPNILKRFGGFDSINYYSKFGNFQKRITSLARDEVNDDVTKDERTPNKDLDIESNVRDRVPKRFSWYRWSFPIIIDGKFYKSLS